ncbi:hypothetical protein [Fluviispira vulneris]|uniref:hypothetical protein n=1 Tax=Fluviispira vulneris TaxID=2763012 RepID=UPI0016485093|nr:hypothetical protein [Fluviispira vulneris]
MSNKRFLFDIKNNRYFSLNEAQDIMNFNMPSSEVFLVLESEKKYLVEINEVFLFQKDIYVFINLDDKISLFTTKIKGDKIFLLLTESVIQFLEKHLNNGVLFCLVKIFLKKILKNWKILSLGLLFVIMLEQKHILSLEDESYTYKYQLKKNIYAVYKDVLRNAHYEIRTETYLPLSKNMDIPLKNKSMEHNKQQTTQKRGERVKAFEFEPDIDLFLKLKKVKKE